MKRVVYIIFSIVQLILLSTSGILTYLSDRKMGVLRSLTYRNLVWNRMDLDRYLLISLLIFIIIGAVYYIVTKKKSMIVLILFDIVAIGYIVLFNTDSIFSYFIIGIALSLILGLELAKSLIR